MVRKVLNRSTVYDSTGKFLFSAGVVLACFVSIRLVREEVDTRVAQHAKYLVIAGTPTFGLPPATPLPTLTPTPLPTATPTPAPAVRLSISAIGVNVSIRETSPITVTTWTGEEQLMWEPVSFAVGHLDTSGAPGEGTNITLLGHNNVDGAVFLRLYELRQGDTVILYTADSEFYYQVQEKIIIPYLGFEADADAKLQFYAAPKPSETVTLISCWPYTSNTNRIVVIAAPAAAGD